MDFSEAVARVKLWVSEDSRDIELSGVEESERRLDLKSPAGSFFITVPQQTEEWVWLSIKRSSIIKLTPSSPQGIWSNDEKCVSILSGGMEQLFQSSNSLEQVLEGTTKLLQAATTAVGMEKSEGGTSSEEEGSGGGEGSDEEEEELDDYYGDEDFDQDLAQAESPDKERSELEVDTLSCVCLCVHVYVCVCVQ